ncbi:MAG: bifunctional phosphoribosyl-AMP cyclohydrolase/phosphoribosyl-ATP diphosphatase HisIE [Chloroflexi bacterium]|nr:bifunctional phosphoribosyl-AMP cyclohydrolase/phosphoribosyl-ATP diphosphatase HisIE [Chloroflexota bacterium]
MKLNLNERGLIPAIAQDEKTGQVLIVAYANPEAVLRTLKSGEAWFYSRSRRELWHKGETSGNVIKVNEVQVDCEGNSLIYRGEPTGPSCHTGKPTCFFQTVEAKGLQFVDSDRDVVDELFAVIESRKRDAPEDSYVAKLLSEGVDRIGKKVIEEAGETVIAAKNGVREETVHEVADLWFHTLILLSHAGLTPDDIKEELRSRRK